MMSKKERHLPCPRCGSDETRRTRNYGKPVGNEQWCTKCGRRWEPELDEAWRGMLDGWEWRVRVRSGTVVTEMRKDDHDDWHRISHSTTGNRERALEKAILVLGRAGGAA